MVILENMNLAKTKEIMTWYKTKFHLTISFMNAVHSFGKDSLYIARDLDNNI